MHGNSRQPDQPECHHLGKPVSDLIADFLIYKETDEANVYEVIDTVSYEEVPMVTDFGSTLP
ncbi:MAG: hypothetical protein IPH20_01565 [Bacteroidales bacterium]|nr:hypothetical protein [Bacteroidales bacterium]